MPKDENGAASASTKENNDFMARQLLQYADDTIPKFSGQDKSYPCARWAQDIDDHIEIFNWTPLQSLVIARRSLSGTAALWLKSERPFKSWVDLKTAILKEFPDTMDQKTIHEIMSTRKKKHNESYLDYMLIMKELGKRGKMPDYVAIRYIVDGLPDSDTNKMMLYCVTTYVDLKEKLRTYEAVKSKIKSTTTQSHVIHQNKEIRCYNCGEKNHRSSECPRKKEGLKCFKCNNFGHIASHCREEYGVGASRQNEGCAGVERNRFGRDRQYSSAPEARRYEDRRSHPSGDERRHQRQADTGMKRAMFGAECDGETGNTTFGGTNGLNMAAIGSESDNDVRDSRCHTQCPPCMNVNKHLKPIIKLFLFHEISVIALADTGSDVSLIDERCFEDLRMHIKCENEDFSLTGLGQKTVKSLGRCSIPVTVDNKKVDITFHVLPAGNIPYLIILGQDFLNNYTVVFNDGSIHILNKGENWFSNFNVGASCNFVVGTNCSSQVREDVIRCVEDYQPDKTKEAPIELKIVLKDDVPVAHRPRRLALREQQIVEKQVEEWLSDDTIRLIECVKYQCYIGRKQIGKMCSVNEEKLVEILNYENKTEVTPFEMCENEEKNVNVDTKLTIIERLKIMKANITVEPIMACYVMQNVLASLATQNLNLEKACRVNLNFSTEICDALNLRQTENYTEYETQVQTLTASIQAWKNVVQTVIPMILILFVGAWSDKTGKRKACIMLPIVGECLSSIGLIINNYFFYELPVEVVALTESIFPAITGGWFMNFVGVFSYISDITTEENRTYRIGIVYLCMSLGFPIGNALSEVLLPWIGYYGVFSLSTASYVFCLLYGYCYLKDPKRPELEGTNGKKDRIRFFGFLKEFFNVSFVIDTFRVAFHKGQGNRRLMVAMLLIAVCLLIGPIYGESRIWYEFIMSRFNWNNLQYSVWSTYSLTINFIGIMISISLFSYYLKLDDTLLGIISCVSKIVASFAYAFARNDVEIYIAPLLEILNGTSFIALRSIATKLVNGKEFGKVNSLFGLAEATMPLVYGPLYSKFYVKTFKFLPGAIFLLGSILILPAVFILIWLNFEHRKDKRKIIGVLQDRKSVDAEICEATV